MNSHNTKDKLVAEKRTIAVKSERDDVRIINSDLAEADELSISTDYDTGGDPYNSTGTHVIITQQQSRDD